MILTDTSINKEKETYVCNMELKFSIAEMTRSETAERLNLENTPGQKELRYMCRLLDELENVRRLFGGPIVITSGYRSEKLNSIVGGKKNSLHLKGKAADIVPGTIAPGEFERLGKALDIWREEKGNMRVLVEGKEHEGKVRVQWYHVELSEEYSHEEVLMLINNSVKGRSKDPKAAEVFAGEMIKRK